jgi:hypothetical protein
MMGANMATVFANDIMECNGMNWNVISISEYFIKTLIPCINIKN